MLKHNRTRVHIKIYGEIFLKKVAKKSLTYGKNMILLQLFFEKSGRFFKASLGINRGLFQRTENE